MLSGIAEWSVPKGGMFFWLKITVLDDVYDVIMNKCLSQGVFAVPGHAFFPDSTKPCPYIRLSYSQTKLEDFDRVCIFTNYTSLSSVFYFINEKFFFSRGLQKWQPSFEKLQLLARRIEFKTAFTYVFNKHNRRSVKNHDFS